MFHFQGKGGAPAAAAHEPRLALPGLPNEETLHFKTFPSLINVPFQGKGRAPAAAAHEPHLALPGVHQRHRPLREVRLLARV